jgi:hypothetical protein
MMTVAVTDRPTANATVSTPALLLHAEGLAMLGAALVAYHALGGSWGLFAALFLVPDLSMLGYLVDLRWGARAYNAAHTLLVPALLAGLGLVSFGASHALYLGAAIWLAHLGADRALGYGLKYPTRFRDSHLQRV